MRFILRTAFRNLMRVPHRTWILVSSLALCAVFCSWMLHFNSAAQRDMVNEIVKHYLGWGHYTHPQYHSPSDHRPNIFAYQRGVFDETGWVSRVSVPAFFSGRAHTVGAMLVGVQWDREKQFSRLASSLRQGQWPMFDGNRDVVIGQRLARKLNVGVGDELMAVGQAVDGSVANDLFRVKGILDFGGGDLEEQVVFTDIVSARAFAAMPVDAIHELVTFDPYRPAPKGTWSYYSWRELLPDVAVSMDFMLAFVGFITLVIMGVVSLGVTNTLLISFRERENEFRTLDVMGIPSSWTINVLLVEVALMTFISLVIGNAISAILVTFFHFHPIGMHLFTGGKPILLGGMSLDPQFRFSWDSRIVLGMDLVLIGMMMLAMLYPIWRAIKRSRYAP